MLMTPLTHPQLLASLARAGHGSQVLIADGNYPLATQTLVTTEQIYLNIRPGLVTVTEMVQLLREVVVFEAAWVMTPDGDDEPSIFAEFRQLLPGISIQRLDRMAFYQHARSTDIAVAIATGEQRLYANIMLTIGVIS